MNHGSLYVGCICMAMLLVGVSGAEVGEPVQVTPDGSGQGLAAIDGDRIAWVDERHGGSDVYLYDIPAATETRITNGTAVPLWPDISGDRIVWEDNRSGAPEVRLYDTAAGTEVRIAAGAVPGIDGDRVVWLDREAGIRAMNLTDSSVASISSGPVQGDPLVVSPDVSGGTIVWVDNFTVFVSRDAGEPVPLGNGSVRQGFPAVAGDRIVWAEFRDGSGSLVVHNLATGEEERIPGGPSGVASSPDISGDLIVWQSFTGRDTDDIYLFDLAAGETRQVTGDDAWQSLPHVSGSRIVWTDNRSGEWNVFLLTLEDAAGTPYDFGIEQNGENVTVPVESEVAISLAENPSTGYSWNATASPGLTVADDRYRPNATPEGVVGAGGTRTWTLVPEQPGTFIFSAVYRRPWENVTGTEDRFDLTITAVADLLDVPSG